MRSIDMLKDVLKNYTQIAPKDRLQSSSNIDSIKRKAAIEEVSYVNRLEQTS